MNEPYVSFDLEKLRKNISVLEKIQGIQFLYPVKCCTHPDVLDIIGESSFGFDVSNLNEFKLVRPYIKNDTIVTSSGPLSYQLYEKYETKYIVFFNSLVHVPRGNIQGLRINFNDDPSFEKSHFGVALSEIPSDLLYQLRYIHFHNSDHRDRGKCESILKQIEIIVSKFKNLRALDVGGHLEDLSTEDALWFIKEVRNIVPDHIFLYAEIGDFLFRDCGLLKCEVVDSYIDNTIYKQIVILNFSKMANQRWVYPSITVSSSDLVETVFYGCSCCETDLYLESEYPIVHKGDELLFKNISTYAYEWNNSFNGINKIKIIFNK